MASESARHRQHSYRNWLPRIPRPITLVIFLLFVGTVVLLIVTTDLKGQVHDLRGQVTDMKHQINDNKQTTLDNRVFGEHSRIITCTLLRAQAPAVIDQISECKNVGANTP